MGFMASFQRYGLFREMGVPAPRSSFSDVEITVGGSKNSGVAAHSVTLGVHLLTEVIDGRFTDTYFPGGDGNLYKEAWPGAVDGDGEVNEAIFINALRTNKGDGADASTFVEFSNAINAANDDYELTKVATPGGRV